MFESLQNNFQTGLQNATNNETDLDMLLISLFWLIIPITLILFAILAAISYAIYNKYFVYSIKTQTESLSI